MNIKTKKRISLAIFICIILLATILRFYKCDLAEFKGDEVHYLWQAHDSLAQGNLPQVGLRTSAGILNFPLFAYIILLFYLVSKSPLFLTSIIILANIIAVVVCYFFLKKHFNEKIAFIASALFAVNPYVVLFSRKLWTNELLPLFSIVFMYFLYNVVFLKDKKSIVFATILLLLTPMLHVSAWYFLIFVPILFYYSSKLKSKKLFFLGCLIPLLAVTPYLHYETTHNWENMRNFISFAQQSSHMDAKIIQLSMNLVTTQGFDYSLGNSYGQFKFPKIRFLNALAILLYIFSVGFAFYRIKDKKILFILLWLLIPILTLIMPKSGVHLHYLIVTFPAQFILMAVFSDFILSKLKSPLNALFCLVLVLIIIYHACFNIAFYNFIDEQKQIHGDYGTPLKYKIEELKNANQTRLKELIGSPDYKYLYEYYLPKNLEK